MLDILCPDLLINIYEKINLIDVLNLSISNKYIRLIYNKLFDNSWKKIVEKEYKDFYWLFLENLKYNKNKKSIKNELIELYNFKSKYEKIDRIDTLILFYIFKLIKL